MNKKGFTLIELLGVVISLGILGLIIFPIVNQNINDSRQKAYDVTIDNLEEAAYKYSVVHSLDYSGAKNEIDFETLKEEGLIEKENIINPKNNEILKGCILYHWDKDFEQFEFVYDEICDTVVE